MPTKTWKLGEVAQGGVITVVTSAKKISVIAKEWDTTTGWNKGSNQSNAKEFNRLEVESSNTNAYRLLSNFLEELSTSYWADEIMKWIDKNSNIKQPSFF